MSQAWFAAWSGPTGASDCDGPARESRCRGGMPEPAGGLPLIGNGVSPEGARISGEARRLIALAYGAVANLVVALSFAALGFALGRGVASRQPLVGMAIATGLGYVAIRILTLSYVPVSMGLYEPRMHVGVYAPALFLAPVLTSESLE